MPPKPKFTKEQVIKAAYTIAKTDGIEAVTAKSLSRVLGASASPLFTLFSSVEEIKRDVRAYAMDEYTARAYKALQYSPSFKQFGMLMISFACEQPNLFRLLFMQKSANPRSFEEILPELGEGVKTCVGLIQSDYSISESHANFVFNQVWLYCFGICVLCANGVCGFSQEELNQMIGKQFMATLLYVKSGKADEVTVTPVKMQ